MPHCSELTVTHRFDVTMQETHRVDTLDGLEDLPPQTQRGADAEGSPSHAPPQVSQVTTLRSEHGRDHKVGQQELCLL